MRKIFWIASILMLSSCQEENISSNSGDDVYPDYYDSYYDGGNVNYETFYTQLSPYGIWVNYPAYGYVWVPQSYTGFSPYLTNGHWVYTGYGWTWVSDFAWGWGPFHYGRWFMDDFYGWMWMPGYDWAPAWVIWGEYGRNYCWAPIGPKVVVSPNYRPAPRHWHIIPHEHITKANLNEHIVKDVPDINEHVTIISNANTYNKSVFFSGPKAQEVEKITGERITTLEVTPSKQPGVVQINGNKMSLYRPGINHENNIQPSKPKNVKNYENVQPATPGSNKPVNVEPPVHQQPTYHATPQQKPTPPQRQYNQNPPVQRQPDKGFIPYQNNKPSPPVQQQRPPIQPKFQNVNPPSVPAQQQPRRK